MKDLNGKTLKVGDYVDYYVEGDLDKKNDRALVVAHIVWTMDDAKQFVRQPVKADNIPCAILARIHNDKVLSTPFYSYELRKLGVEELI